MENVHKEEIAVSRSATAAPLCDTYGIFRILNSVREVLPIIDY